MREDILKEAVKNSFSFSEVIRKLGVMYRSGGALLSLKREIEKLNIDHSHFLGMAHRRGSEGKKQSWEEILVDSRGRLHRESARKLRRAMVEMGVEERCKICKLGKKWKAKWLVLDIDHIDGDWRNNSPGNLRFLCPNCHSQQETSGRARGPIVVRKCDLSAACLCIRCTNRRSAFLAPHPDKGRWPDGLADIVSRTPITHIALMVGVSETAVRKRLKRLGIQSKPKGYWSAKKHTDVAQLAEAARSERV